MPFAAEGRISQAPIEGGIGITEQQYQQGLAGILAGKIISIANGFAVLDPPSPEDPEDPEDPGEPPVSLVEVAGARLIVDQDGWSVSGVERSKGIAGADLVDVDVVWVFFSDPQTDTDYVVIPPDGVTKFEGYVEVSRPGLTSINLIIQRVQ